MPINTKGGRSHKKGKNKPTIDRQVLITRDGSAQNYGLITKALGDRRMSLVDPDNQTYIARIRGKMKGRQRIRPGDIVLFSYRETGEKKVDIILKYSDDQAKRIIRSENINFPDGDHSFGNRNANSNLVFDDEVEVPNSSTKETLVSGIDRIKAIYADDSEDEDNEEDEEDYEIYEESVHTDVENAEPGVDHRKKVANQKLRTSHRNAKTAAQHLSVDDNFDIDAI